MEVIDWKRIWTKCPPRFGMMYYNYKNYSLVTSNDNLPQCGECVKGMRENNDLADSVTFIKCTFRMFVCQNKI